MSSCRNWLLLGGFLQDVGGLGGPAITAGVIVVPASLVSQAIDFAGDCDHLGMMEKAPQKPPHATDGHQEFHRDTLGPRSALINRHLGGTPDASLTSTF